MPHYMPDSTYASLLKYDEDRSITKRERLGKIRALICDGNRDRFHLKRKVTYHPPNVDYLALDVAALKIKESLQAARSFAKFEFYQRAAGGGGAPDNFSSIPAAEDLKYLLQSFTFSLSKEFIVKLMGKSYLKSDFDNDYMIQYYGWKNDRDGTRFSATEALNNADYMWPKILAFSTEVLEAQNQDGSVTFSINLNFQSFCQFSVANADLIAGGSM
jgi:hypothetical protein